MSSLLAGVLLGLLLLWLLLRQEKRQVAQAPVAVVTPPSPTRTVLLSDPNLLLVLLGDRDIQRNPIGPGGPFHRMVETRKRPPQLRHDILKQIALPFFVGASKSMADLENQGLVLFDLPEECFFHGVSVGRLPYYSQLARFSYSNLD